MPHSELAARYAAVRHFSERIAEPLSGEDCAIQSMPDTSPTRWHLAHTTWFFETFLLKQMQGYRPYDPSFEFLFNSYYNTVGAQFPRSQRGLISRPGLRETLAYRKHVDQAIAESLHRSEWSSAQCDVMNIGLNHEQQHQELMLTDIKHVLFRNPLAPVYRLDDPASQPAGQLQWLSFEEGIVWIGDESDGFAFDNERPRHRVFVHPFRIAHRCVTNGEYLAFIEDGGYKRPEFWLAMGWDAVQTRGWQAPMYWSNRDGEWSLFTLSGLKRLDENAPVCHVSYFEADAYARWAGHRLPTEQEWEHAVACERGLPANDPVGRGEGHWSDTLLRSGLTVHPQSGPGPALTGRFENILGNAWEWTSSPYVAYPGYRPPEGALGEYNGKFMCNQFVLRGGSCATPEGHIRTTYRNFFPPEAQWQFSTIRLADGSDSADR